MRHMAVSIVIRTPVLPIPALKKANMGQGITDTILLNFVDFVQKIKVSNHKTEQFDLMFNIMKVASQLEIFSKLTKISHNTD